MMAVRTRITLLFAAIVLIILGIVCGSIYYFSYTNRIRSSRGRLANFAITTGSLLGRSETFGHDLIQQIDSSTTIALIDKTVAVFDQLGNNVYAYSDKPGDVLIYPDNILNETKEKGKVYFPVNAREAISYYYKTSRFEGVIMVAAFDKEGKDSLHQLRFVLLYSFFAGLLVGVLGGYWFSKSLLKPVKKIADEVHEISAQNLTRRIYAGNENDEWSYLSGTLNELLNRLQESFEIQGRFIANASHELSTPLSSISSQLEVALQREREAGEYRRVMKSVHQDVLQLNKLTQTLLEFAKASGTAAGIEISLVRVDEVLLQIKSDLTKLDKEYSVLLDFSNLPEEEEQLLLLGNEPLLLTAVKNIVVNACKYSADHTAKIKLGVQEHNIIIEVADEGAGITEAALKNIFQPFYRSDSGIALKGSGLGLSLAYRIIRLHKGSIEVVSAVGKGSIFTVHLPAAVK